MNIYVHFFDAAVFCVFKLLISISFLNSGTHYDDSVRSRSLVKGALKRKREDSEGVVRSSSRVPRDKSGVRNEEVRIRLKKEARNQQKKMAREARKGEGDRHIYDLKPKHLFAGKMSSGSRSRR